MTDEVRSPFRFRYALILFLLMWGMLEGALLGLLAVGRSRDLWDYRPISTRSLNSTQRDLLQRMLSGEGYIRLDADLGWTTAAGGSSKDGLYHVNAQELRGERLYSREVPPGKIRLTTYGDSFTFGAFVRDGETWQAQLEAAEPGVEALNLGVNGYGPDQAYLRYGKTVDQFDANVVVIGYMSENISRLVNRFRPFYNPFEELILSKPRFELGEGDALTLNENPLRTPDDYRKLLRDPGEVLSALAEHDYWAQVRNRSSIVDILPSVKVAKILLYHVRHRTGPDYIFERNGTYRVASPAYRILVAVMERFYRAVEGRKQLPIVLIYPRPEDGASVPGYAPLLSFLSSRGMRYVDVLPELIKEVGSSHLIDLYFDGHLNARGNGIVARVMAKRLRELGLVESAAATPPTSPSSRRTPPLAD